VIDLGRTLELEVIAEGIEHAEQARWLMDLGCRFGQGFLYARPVGAAALEALLAEGAGLAGATSDGAPARDEPDDPRRLRLVSGD
jgi:EAL domain-containing protein (putative c-di-GMP-specific phosphodiesterase class I)